MKAQIIFKFLEFTVLVKLGRMSFTCRRLGNLLDCRRDNNMKNASTRLVGQVEEPIVGLEST